MIAIAARDKKKLPSFFERKISQNNYGKENGTPKIMYLVSYTSFAKSNQLPKYTSFEVAHTNPLRLIKKSIIQQMKNGNYFEIQLDTMNIEDEL